MGPTRNVITIIGSGGMGLATARRLGSGRRILLADFSERNLEEAAKSLHNDGHDVATHIVDVADFSSVKRFAEIASNAGYLEAVVHTAGLSPAMASARRIFDVDLVGTANVIDAFYEVVPSGSSLVCIASIARFMSPASTELERHFATSSRDTLLTHQELDQDLSSSALAYSLSKRANILRVQAAARPWAEKGARINSISPGVIITPMIREELKSAAGSQVQTIIDSAPLRRGGTADEIANVVSFLASSQASYITGTDIVVDGGFVPGSQFGGSVPK